MILVVNNYFGYCGNSLSEMRFFRALKRIENRNQIQRADGSREGGLGFARWEGSPVPHKFASSPTSPKGQGQKMANWR